MRTFYTLGFAAAADKQVGDYVASGDRAFRILAIQPIGKNSPYFQMEGIDPNDYRCLDAPGFVSWQILGDARPCGFEAIEKETWDKIDQAQS